MMSISASLVMFIEANRFPLSPVFQVTCVVLRNASCDSSDLPETAQLRQRAMRNDGNVRRDAMRHHRPKRAPRVTARIPTASPRQHRRRIDVIALIFVPDCRCAAAGDDFGGLDEDVLVVAG